MDQYYQSKIKFFLLVIDNISQTVCDSAVFKIKRTCPKGQSQAYILNCCNDMHQHDSYIHTLFHTYLSSVALERAAPQRMSLSLLSSQSRQSLFTHHMGWDAQQLPIDSLAWPFFLAWLAQISLLIAIPTRTLIKPQRYRSQLNKQHAVTK